MTGGLSDLIIDAAGVDPLTVLSSDDALHLDLAPDPLLVEFEAVGLPGRDGSGSDIEAVAALDLAAGMPVAIDRATGRFIKADAAYKPSAFVAGLLKVAATSGFVATGAAASLTLADWSAVTGTAQLSPGLPYFLAAGGGLTTNAPDSDCVTYVGKALNAGTLLIAPQPPLER